ncbi:MAG: hypothetical protein NTZ35_17610 [Ignavibacteriales bacterium]|nr:hypothetical protein [Ignavibacteriales bacterium]
MNRRQAYVLQAVVVRHKKESRQMPGKETVCRDISNAGTGVRSALALHVL